MSQFQIRCKTPPAANCCLVANLTRDEQATCRAASGSKHLLHARAGARQRAAGALQSAGRWRGWRAAGHATEPAARVQPRAQATAQLRAGAAHCQARLQRRLQGTCQVSTAV